MTSSSPPIPSFDRRSESGDDRDDSFAAFVYIFAGGKLRQCRFSHLRRSDDVFAGRGLDSDSASDAPDGSASNYASSSSSSSSCPRASTFASRSMISRRLARVSDVEIVHLMKMMRLKGRWRSVLGFRAGGERDLPQVVRRPGELRLDAAEDRRHRSTPICLATSFSGCLEGRRN